MARVLLLEPDKLLAENVTAALKRRGYSVDWQVEPQAATNSADLNKPDIIILDLFLAGRSGTEFLYELRSYPDWRDVPVVVYSNVLPEELAPSINSLNSLNVAGYYYKPATSLNQLTNAVDNILQPTKT